MIFDLIFGFFIIGAFVTGYKNGLLTTILRTVFFFAGAIAAIYFVVQYNKTGWLIAAIITGAYAAAWVGTQIAKTLKLTLVRGPLRWLDSLLGAAFEAAKYLVLFYLIGTILLWAPWSPGQNSVSESKAYLKMQSYAPTFIESLKRELERKLQ